MCTHLTADSFKKDPKELLESQVSMLDDLIIMTQRTLKSEEEIKAQIIEYQHIQEAYLKNQENKEIVKIQYFEHRQKRWKLYFSVIILK